MVAYFQHSQREFKQLARGQVFFADLNEVDPEMHLLTDNFQQRTETADGLAIGNVITLHCLRLRLAENRGLILARCSPDEVYSRGWDFDSQAILSAELFEIRLADDGDD